MVISKSAVSFLQRAGLLHSYVVPNAAIAPGDSPAHTFGLESRKVLAALRFDGAPPPDRVDSVDPWPAGPSR